MNEDMKERLTRVMLYDDEGIVFGEYHFSNQDDNSVEVDEFLATLEDLNGEVHMSITHYVEDTDRTYRN